MFNKNVILKCLYPVVLATIIASSYFDPHIESMAAGIALISGVLLTLLFGNPYADLTKKISSNLLSWSVIGLGFGMNLLTVLKVGAHGLLYTILGIFIAIILGLFLGRLFKNNQEASLLVSVGTAICGGSAIAAISPVIRAKHHNITVALGVVFLLNAIALFTFPHIGKIFHLTQEQFGLWSALAIHDTSSVVGACLQYGAKALEIGTTVKLARALWIVPTALVISYIYAKNKKQENASNAGLSKTKKPWFILWFIVAAAVMTFFPELRPAGMIIHGLAEKGLVITLFCIGSNLSKQALKEVGAPLLMQGVTLWLMISLLTLALVHLQIISV